MPRLVLDEPTDLRLIPVGVADLLEPEFERRMAQPNAPFIQNIDGTISTHKMAWGSDDIGFYAYPTIVNRNGKLTELSFEEADEYAHQTGELKRFDTQSEAESYAAGSWKKKSRLAEFGGEIKHIPWHQYVPFTGSTVTALETFDLYRATRRLEDLDYPKGWEGELRQELDEQRIATFFTEQERQAQLGFGGKVARGLSILPSWMGEFLLTGGLYSLGKKGAAKLGGKALTQWLAGSAARTTLGAPQRTVEAVLKRKIMEEPEGWATSIAKGWGEVFIEMASEEAGAGITNILKKGVGKMPFGKKFIDGLFKAWEKITPKGTKAAFLNQVFTKAGYSNLIGEIGEERLATIMHALAKTEDFGAGKSAGRFQRLVAGIEQDYRNFPVELTVLSVPGAARFTLGKMIGAEAPRIEPEAITPAEGIKPKPTEAKPATREQKAQAHILARERGITEEDYRELAGKSMAEMSSVEAERFIDALRVPAERLDLTDPERKTIREFAGSEETFVRTIDYATRLGDVPKEKQLRKAYIQNLQSVAKSQQRHALKLELKEGKVNLINQFSSARYATGQAEIKSGRLLRQKHTNIVYKANEAKLQALNIVTTALKKAGTTPFRVAMKKQQNDRIAEWLFEEDTAKRKTKWTKLDGPTRAVATKLHEIFQGPGALNAREAMWYIWDEGGRQPSNAPDSALEEGRQAKREGRLKEWIASQSWGTREFYYMSSAQIGDLAESLSKMAMSLSIEEKPPKVGAKPKVYLPEVKARKYAKRAKGGSVINATLDHLERLMVANAVHDSLKTFWSDFAKAEPTREDISIMKEFINSALGKHRRAVLPVRAVRKVGRAFWRFYFISPLKAGWFATRNLLQNIAWGPSELPISQWMLSAKRILAEKITGRANEERAADFARDFKVKISQKRQMYRQFLLQEEGNITKTAGNRALVLMDMAGSAAVLSDEANRIMCWPIMYDAAQKNLNLYLNGKISYNKLARRLKLDTFHLSQQLELQQLANKRGKRDFVAKFAEYKTENVHFRYETAFRSAAEQTPAGRVIMGLYVYPKGVAELIYQNSVKPTIQGWQTGNYNKAYQGLTVLMMLFAGGAAAERLIREIAGRYAYDILGTILNYNPFGPGAGLLLDFFKRIGGVVRMAEREKKSPAEIADAAAAAAVDQLEFFIPMCDGYINYYENKNNKGGVRLYRLMKKEALSKYFRVKRIKFRKSNRDFHERIQHQLFGGAEWPEKE